jgi:hypothetical protein
VEIERACKILEAVTEAMDYVAAHPEKAPQLAIELLQKCPHIYTALSALVRPEDRPIIHELFKSALNLAKSLAKNYGEKHGTNSS